MIWLTWRQVRLVFAVLFVLSVALLVWTAVVSHSYADTVRSAHGVCNGASGSPFCETVRGHLARIEDEASLIGGLLWLLPLVLGLAVGAPLIAAAFEDRSVVLDLTQSVSRSRWAILRLAVAGGAALVLSAVVLVFADRWFAPVQTDAGFAFVAASRVLPGPFDVTGVVPVAYTLFAFALGAASGAVVRRSSIAGILTVVTYLVTRVVFLTAVRPRLAAQTFVPFVANGEVGGYVSAGGLRAWAVRNGYGYTRGHGAAGRSADQVAAACHRPTAPTGCLTAHHVAFGTFIQPAAHYWALQWGEFAAFTAAAVVLLTVAVFAVRRWRG